MAGVRFSKWCLSATRIHPAAEAGFAKGCIQDTVERRIAGREFEKTRKKQFPRADSRCQFRFANRRIEDTQRIQRPSSSLRVLRQMQLLTRHEQSKKEDRAVRPRLQGLARIFHQVLYRTKREQSQDLHRALVPEKNQMLFAVTRPNVPGIHVFWRCQARRGWPDKPGHDERMGHNPMPLI
jgi:hypothetical protein